MDRFKACSNMQPDEIQGEQKLSLSDLLDELDSLVAGIPEERYDELMELLQDEIDREEKANGED